MIIPHLFGKEPLGNVVNPGLLQAIHKVTKANTKMEAVETAVGIITKKYVSYRYRTYLLFWRAWETDPNKLWERNGFLHCTHQNFLVRLLLIKSGWFREEDIQLGYSFVWFVSIHQYLQLHMDGTWMAVDPWNVRYGAKIGTYAWGFGFKHL